MTTRPFDTGLTLRTADNTPAVTPGSGATPRTAAVVASRPAPSATGPLTFVQRQPATTWTIRHQFRRRPQVQLQGVDGKLLYGAVQHRDLGWVEVTFSEAVAGRAVLT